MTKQTTTKKRFLVIDGPQEGWVYGLRELAKIAYCRECVDEKGLDRCAGHKARGGN